jgi:hypothetical protein
MAAISVRSHRDGGPRAVFLPQALFQRPAVTPPRAGRYQEHQAEQPELYDPHRGRKINEEPRRVAGLSFTGSPMIRGS